MTLANALLLELKEPVHYTDESKRLYNEIIKQYEVEEKLIPVEYLLDKVTYASPVNFRESMHTARHRWFPYKEGFSPSFVRAFMKRYAKPNAQTVFDPFGGVGTTLLECCRLHKNSFGFEVSPMSYFIAKTKAETYSSADFKTFDHWLTGFQDAALEPVAAAPANATVVSYFEPRYLEAILKVKAFYRQIDDQKSKNLFKLAFLSCLERYSTHRKAGNGLKKKSRFTYTDTFEAPIEQVKQSVISELKKYRADLVEEPVINNYFLMYGSCLDAEAYPKDAQFDAVLTSPPYANCFDYSKIYMVELWLGDFFTDKNSQKDFRRNSLRSHVHARWDARNTTFSIGLISNQIYSFLAAQKLWSPQIPNMIRGYFEDMGRWDVCFRCFRSVVRQEPL